MYGHMILKDQTVTAIWEYRRCLLKESYDTYKFRQQNAKILCNFQANGTYSYLILCVENIFLQEVEDCHRSKSSFYCVTVLFILLIFSNFKFLLLSFKGTDNNLIAITTLNKSDSK